VVARLPPTGEVQKLAPQKKKKKKKKKPKTTPKNTPNKEKQDTKVKYHYEQRIRKIQNVG
jgi:hypothetical protein